MALALDLMVTVYILLEIFRSNDNLENYDSFGWAFMNVYFGLPILSPLLQYFGAFTTDIELLKEASNFNAYVNLVNIPLSIFACWLTEGDIIYIMIFLFLMLIKMALSTVSGKVRMHI